MSCLQSCLVHVCSMIGFIKTDEVNLSLECQFPEDFVFSIVLVIINLQIIIFDLEPLNSELFYILCLTKSIIIKICALLSIYNKCLW